MKKTVKHYLDDIWESIEKIEEYIKGVSEEQFSRNSQLQDSVLHRIQIIGEIAKRIPAAYKKLYPSVPWRDVAGMRDMIVHGYDGVDLSIVWDVVQRYIPKLKPSIKKMLSEKDRHKVEFKS